MDAELNVEKLAADYPALTPDIVESTIRRYRRKLPLSQADREDMHQDLMDANTQEKSRVESVQEKKRGLHLRNSPLVKKELNLVLLGKTGAGKSSTGNMMMGAEVFEHSNSPTSSTSYIQPHSVDVDGIRINIIDTPGLMDTNKPLPEIIAEISRVIEHFSDGIDAFLYVYNIADPHFTAEDREAFNIISQKVFGADSTQHCFIILTHVEYVQDFTSLHDYLTQEAASAFKKLILKALKGRVIAVNNFEPTVYGRELQRKNLIKLIQQNVNERYMSDKFEKFKREKEDLEKKRPEVLKPFVPYIDQRADQLLGQLSRDALREMTFNDRSHMSQIIATEVTQNNTIKDMWTDALLRMIEDLIREKADRLVTQALREKEEEALREIRAEGDRMHQELRMLKQQQEQENKRAKQLFEEEKARQLREFNMEREHRQREFDFHQKQQVEAQEQLKRVQQEFEEQRREREREIARREEAIRENERKQREQVQQVVVKEQKPGILERILGGVTGAMSKCVIS